jgi:hypothetical protein
VRVELLQLTVKMVFTPVSGSGRWSCCCCRLFGWLHCGEESSCWAGRLREGRGSRGTKPCLSFFVRAWGRRLVCFAESERVMFFITGEVSRERGEMEGNREDWKWQGEGRMAGPSLGEEAPDSKPQGRGSLQFFWMEAVSCLLEEKGLLLGLQWGREWDFWQGKMAGYGRWQWGGCVQRRKENGDEGGGGRRLPVYEFRLGFLFPPLVFFSVSPPKIFLSPCKFLPPYFFTVAWLL